jgi:hypothetical protein
MKLVVCAGGGMHRDETQNPTAHLWPAVIVSPYLFPARQQHVVSLVEAIDPL